MDNSDGDQDDDQNDAPDQTETPESETQANGRRRRSLEEILADDKDRLEQQQHVRTKRAVKYKCNENVVLGVMFYDIYNRTGILAKRCCCTPYKGELFDFNVTIDEAWTNILKDQRSPIFRYNFV